MSWIANLWNVLRGDAAVNFKAITSELKELKDEYKSRMKDAENRIKELHTEHKRAAEAEAECHRQVVDLTQKYRDTREELIFIKRMIKDHNHDT
jgi:acetyl-CoA carboxylase carboxyltransferase component